MRRHVTMRAAAAVAALHLRLHPPRPRDRPPDRRRRHRRRPLRPRRRRALADGGGGGRRGAGVAALGWRLAGGAQPVRAARRPAAPRAPQRPRPPRHRLRSPGPAGRWPPPRRRHRADARPAAGRRWRWGGAGGCDGGVGAAAGGAGMGGGGGYRAGAGGRRRRGAAGGAVVPAELPAGGVRPGRAWPGRAGRADCPETKQSIQYGTQYESNRERFFSSSSFVIIRCACPADCPQWPVRTSRSSYVTNSPCTRSSPPPLQASMIRLPAPNGRRGQPRQGRAGAPATSLGIGRRRAELLIKSL